MEMSEFDPSRSDPSLKGHAWSEKERSLRVKFIFVVTVLTATSVVLVAVLAPVLYFSSSVCQNDNKL